MTDKEFLLDPDKWPNWPICPIERRTQTSLETAVVLGDIADKVMIAKCNMYSLPSDIRTVETQEYPSVDALLADGWQVD